MARPIQEDLSMQPAKAALSLFEEFKQFALKGNVVDLAVGVIIGAAFAKIVDSLVKNIVMPLVGVLMPSDKGYEGFALDLPRGGTMPVGLFIGDVLNFAIVALALFIFVVKFLGWIMRTKKQEAVAPPPPTNEEQLLTEIRDLLKAKI